MLLFFPLRRSYFSAILFFFFYSEVQAQCPVPTHPTAIATHPTCTVRTGIITVNNPAPGPGVIYSINGKDNNTTGIFSDLAAPGTYSVTVNYGQGCISLPLSVAINAPPPVPAQPTVTPTQPTCALVTGTITVNAPIPALGNSYSIDGRDYSNTTGSFPGLAPNTYNVTVKNSAGCISPERTITINSPPSMPVANVTAVDIPCGQSTGKFTVNVTGGTSPFTYSLNGLTPVANSSFSNLAAGSYKVTVKDAAGCSSDASVTIKEIGCLPISESKVFVPTAFTPDNNNKNDYLQPYLLNIRELAYFKVYNRWGQLVFLTNTIGKGWDGNIQGIKQPGETYTWILACIDIGGKVIKQNGRSLLVR